MGRIPGLSLRFAYDLPGFGPAGAEVRPRLLLDIFHLFSQRKPVVYDNVKGTINLETGEFTDANPTFNEPIAFQPPMTIRLGLEATL